MTEDITVHLDEAERKAWDSLSRYKFQMFGYWAAIWVHLNRISGEKRPNPWAELVKFARENNGPKVPPTVAFAELRNQFGDLFDAIEDPDAWVKEQRRGEE